MIEFGEKIPGQVYTPRPGAYAIVFNDAGEVGVVQNPKGYFLLGGGVEGDETPEEALHREVREEIGMGIQIDKKIGTALQYVNLPEIPVYICKEAHFYRCTLTQKISDTSEDTHTFHWLPMNEVLEKIYHPSHKWAIEQAL